MKKLHWFIFFKRIKLFYILNHKSNIKEIKEIKIILFIFTNLLFTRLFISQKIKKKITFKVTILLFRNN